MNKKTLVTMIVLMLGVTGISFGFFIQAKAQKAEAVIPYVEERFKQENIPVVEITVLEHSPLRLQVTVQSAGEWSDSENSALWTSIQRVVFLDARQAGYSVESLEGILQDSQSRQLDYAEQDAGQVQFDYLTPRHTPSVRLTDEETKEFLLKKIGPLLGEYKLDGIPLTVDVSSKAGRQKVTVELQVVSQDVENAQFFAWKLPEHGVFRDADAEGANIFWYQPRVIDENGANLTEMISFTFPHGSDDGWTDQIP